MTLPLGEKILIGTSGWSCKDWTGPFYPDGCAPKDRLTHQLISRLGKLP